MPDYNVNDYTYSTRWEPKEGCFIASCKEYPGLSCDGPTPEEAIEEMKFLVEFSNDVLPEHGIAAIPPRKQKKSHEIERVY